MAKAPAKNKPTVKKKAPAPKKTAGILSVPEFAKLVEVSRQRILKAIETGVLSNSITIDKSTKRKLYKVNEKKGLKEWEAHIDPAKKRDNGKQSETRDMDKKENEPSAYQKSKAAREFFNAKIARLNYEERAGTLVDAEEVKKESYKIGRRVRASMLGLPERVAAELANMKEPREIAVYLKEQIAGALKDLDNINNVGKSK